MEGLTTGFPFGMGGEDFGAMDFQTSMSGEVGGGGPPLMHPSMSPYNPFCHSMSRETVFPQNNLMGHRSGGMELPRFPLVPYAQNIPMPNHSFNQMMSPRHSFSTSGLSNISSFGDMFPPQVSGGDGCTGGGGGSMVDSISDRLPNFNSIMISSPGPTTLMQPSTPVFPSAPSSSSMVHTSSASAAESSQKQSLCGSQNSATRSSSTENNEQLAARGSSSHSHRSPIQSPIPSLQSCFPGQMPHPQPQQHQQQQQSSVVQQLSTRSVQQQTVPLQNNSPSSQFSPRSDVKPFPMSSEVQSVNFNTMMPRRRQSPRRAAAMVAQATAAAAAAALAIETKQIKIPSMSDMLCRGESQIMGGPMGMNFPPQIDRNMASMNAVQYMQGGMPQNCLPPFHTVDGSRRDCGTGNGGDMGVRQQSNNHAGPLMSGYPTRRTIVPFFKAGRFSLREPEVFECQMPRVPQVTESSQTGLDTPKKKSGSGEKHFFPVIPNSFSNINPMDGKGGFPFPREGGNNRLNRLPGEGGIDGVKNLTTSFTEGEGYAKRGNSKTVVSPSFGEAAARAVMTTCVADSATFVTVAIMSRQSSMLKPKVTNSVVSPGATHVHGQSTTDDVKENILRNSTLAGGNDKTLTEEVATPRIQTRRGRRPNGNVSVSVPVTSQRGRRLRQRVITENNISDDENFEKIMEERKEKARAAEQERLEISVRIDDSQCVTYGEQKRWQCNLCDKSYTTKHNLVMHILDHNGIKPHLCLVCGKYFKQLSHLNTHMLTHDNVRPHVCTLCGKGFTQISHLKRHQAVHLDSKPYYCDVCGRGFTYPSELRLHKERHLQDSTTSGEHCCLECGEEFPNAAQLSQHQLLHENREELICTFCGRKFRYPSQLKDHVVIHSGSRPYMCTECGMDFMKEHHLRAHQFTHTGLRPFSCPICGRAFNQRANMQRHMLIHKAERSYKCDCCDKTFTQPQTLKAHMVVHADHKPYKCQLCSKEFGRLHNLHGHMHMHNNTKPYVCFCGSSFTLKGNLNRHKKVKHGLNESTESMEEDVVNYLSSRRAREEPSGDETMDGLDSSSLDVPDKASSRKQRKSTPRKIPRRSSGSNRKHKEGGDMDEADEDECEDENDEFDDEEDEEGVMKTEGLPSLHFQALTDETETPGSLESDLKRTHNEEEEEEGDKHADEEEEEEEVAIKKSRRLSERQRGLHRTGDFLQDLSDTDKEDAGQDGTLDEDWLPSSESRKKDGKGAKLDSLIAEKFKSA